MLQIIRVHNIQQINKQINIVVLVYDSEFITESLVWVTNYIMSHDPWHLVWSDTGIKWMRDEVSGLGRSNTRIKWTRDEVRGLEWNDSGVKWQPCYCIPGWSCWNPIIYGSWTGSLSCIFPKYCVYLLLPLHIQSSKQPSKWHIKLNMSLLQQETAVS